MAKKAQTTKSKVTKITINDSAKSSQTKSASKSKSKKASTKPKAKKTKSKSTPKIIKDKVRYPIDTKIDSKPEPAKPLTHGQTSIGKSKNQDIYPDTATPRRKLAPLELPIEGSLSVIDNNSKDKPKLEQPEPKKVESEDKSLQAEVEAELDKPDKSEEHDVFDDILEQFENHNLPPVTKEPHHNLNRQKKSEDIVSESLETDMTTQLKRQADNQNNIKTTDVNSYHLPIKDKYFKNAGSYFVEFFVVIVLLLIFIVILIDIELIDLGFDLPYDLL